MKEEEELEEEEVKDILVGGEGDIFEFVTITKVRKKNADKSNKEADTNGDS